MRAFDVARAFVPSLATHVTRLYRAAGTEAPAIALAWTLVILTGEELLWRGAWIDVWAPRLGATIAAVSSVLAFAHHAARKWLGHRRRRWPAPAAPSGRPCACTPAASCPGLIAHAIWTPIVIVLFPVV